MNPLNRSHVEADTADSTLQGRDPGSILVLVLVMVIIGALIVIPVMNYSVTVFRANSVLSDKTQRFETVKAGMRTSLYDPLQLYRHCDEEVAPKLISTVEVNDIEVRTSCQLVGFAKTVIGDHLRFGLVATATGQTIPPALKGKKYASGAVPADWIGLTTSSFQDPGNPDAWDKVWLPDLPPHPRTIRTRVEGHGMPAGFGGCKVYFPGKYVDDVLIDGKTFFASGIYYFEGEVSVVGGADVVVGDGRAAGCASSQEAVFFADPPLPPGQPHNITGFGATWLFGGEGRLVVSNANNLPLRFEFNRRYVDDTNTDPSLFVSIASVNGELQGAAVQDLVAPNLHVPASRVLVGKDPDDPNILIHESPAQHEMRPSSLTSTPRVPAAPVGVTATGFRRSAATPPPPLPATPAITATNGALITWTAPAPADQGGVPVERYEVYRKNETTPLCIVPVATGQPLDCLVTGLAGSGSGTTHEFDVVAFNAKGASTRAPVSVVIRTSTTPTTPTYVAPSITLPGTTTPPAVDLFRDGFRVAVPTTTPGTLPITAFTMTALVQSGSDWVPVGTPCTINPRLPGAPTSCTVRGLTPAVDYRFRVTVENPLALSAISASTTTAFQLTPALPVAPADPPLPPPPGLPVVPPVVAPPIVDFDLAAASSTAVRVPGYIAVPQSSIRINNPQGHVVQAIGGILASSMNIVDGRDTSANCTSPAAPATPGVNCIDLGFESEAVQKRLRIVSSTTVGAEMSVALIQVNENGAYAVNSWEVQ